MVNQIAQSKRSCRRRATVKISKEINYQYLLVGKRHTKIRKCWHIYVGRRSPTIVEVVRLSLLLVWYTLALVNSEATVSTTASLPSTIFKTSTKNFNNCLLRTPTNIAAGYLDKSLKKQGIQTTQYYQSNKYQQQYKQQHYKNHQFYKNSYPIDNDSFTRFIRIALAGGIAGGTGTLLLYPIDAAKTLRQSLPSKFPSVTVALRNLIYSNQQWHIGRVYIGVLPATLGAIPSSALYFGAYENMKTLIQSIMPIDKTKLYSRLWIHGVSAASGNVLSSLIFVPKEFVKQQMQYQGSGNVGDICATVLKNQGIKGLYCGYQATLLRNIPSAMTRFVIYEELKFHWFTKRQVHDINTTTQLTPSFNVRLFMAGAVAGAIASGLLTPIDVLKTRVSTGTCPVNGVRSCLQHIIQEQGYRGLYAGAGSRMLWSGAFAAVGFGTLEAMKGWLGVADSVKSATLLETTASSPLSPLRPSVPSPVFQFSHHSRQLQHALAGAHVERSL